MLGPMGDDDERAATPPPAHVSVSGREGLGVVPYSPAKQGLLALACEVRNRDIPQNEAHESSANVLGLARRDE